MANPRPPSSFALRRLVVSLGLGAALASGASPAPAAPVVSRPTLVDPKAKIINISAATQVFYKGDKLRFTVLRATPGTCAEVRVSLQGQSLIYRGVAFPWTLEIAPNTPLYPKKGAKYEVRVEGVSGCTGSVAYTFAYNDSDKGIVTGVALTGFDKPETAAVQILGRGMCRLRVATYQAPVVYGKEVVYELVFLDKPVRLPTTVPLKRSAEIGANYGGDQVLELITLGMMYGAPTAESKKAYPSWEGCVLTGPDALAEHTLRKTYSTVKAGGNASSGNTSGGTAGAGGAAGGGGGPAAPKPANGKIVSMLVPGGSFAEDEAQKIQVNGQGGCNFDLTISNKSYGGSYEQTFPVTGQKLDGGATLYNGTHFGTLAEGSWKATSVGKSGCTGTATIDFKVTPKTSTKKVAGKPTIAFDQQPKGGGNTFMASKDGNIWFRVTVPQSVKDEPYATCCDVEFDYINEYGGWQPLPNSPFSDSSYGLAVKQSNAVVPKSVAYFSQGTQWRVKVRASKYKTEFDWSDWLEFKVDQH